MEVLYTFLLVPGLIMATFGYTVLCGAAMHLYDSHKYGWSKDFAVIWMLLGAAVGCIGVVLWLKSYGDVLNAWALVMGVIATMLIVTLVCLRVFGFPTSHGDIANQQHTEG